MPNWGIKIIEDIAGMNKTVFTDELNDHFSDFHPILLKFVLSRTYQDGKIGNRRGYFIYATDNPNSPNPQPAQLPTVGNTVIYQGKAVYNIPFYPHPKSGAFLWDCISSVQSSTSASYEELADAALKEVVGHLGKLDTGTALLAKIGVTSWWDGTSNQAIANLLIPNTATGTPDAIVSEPPTWQPFLLGVDQNDPETKIRNFLAQYTANRHPLQIKMAQYCPNAGTYSYGHITEQFWLTSSGPETKTADNGVSFAPLPNFQETLDGKGKWIRALVPSGSFDQSRTTLGYFDSDQNYWGEFVPSDFYQPPNADGPLDNYWSNWLQIARFVPYSTNS